MLKEYGSITLLGWLSATLLLACSGSYVKGVGEVEGGAGKGADTIGETAGSAAIAGGKSIGAGGDSGSPSVEPTSGGSATTSGGSGGAPVEPPEGCDETTPPFCVDNDIYICPVPTAAKCSRRVARLGGIAQFWATPRTANRTRASRVCPLASAIRQANVARTAFQSAR